MAGNNAHAYLDAVSDNTPDTGGTTISDGNFVSVFDATIQPSVAVNRNVAVQNLFYLNNVIHDRLYLAGFQEGTGNFQEDNFGLGGRRSDSDSVNAEAQDGGGTDNANFATPRDGQNPRMQMYLWSSPQPDHEVVINTPTGYPNMPARRAAFGATLDATGLTDDVVLVNDNTSGGTVTDGCETIVNDVSGKIAMIDRGFCTFVIKVKNAQNAGAVGIIMINNQGDDPIVMGGTDATITTPSVMIGQTNGTTLKGLTGVNATMRLLDPPPIKRDGDVDSDIVWHEYGHGLTWRMIGRMDGPMSGAIGEGMSDVLSIIINNDDVVGEYSFGNTNGIRSEPYANYSRTYVDITGSEVHFDGELYGAIGWRLWQNFQTAALGKDVLLGYLVDGMNFTPAHPKFENMRDGILSAVAGSGRECLVWEAFAHYGVGVGAKGAVRGSKVVVTESFAMPASCP
ncbi:MAG: M36 family metallopeptidase [Luteimonas sp.]